VGKTKNLKYYKELKYNIIIENESDNEKNRFIAYAEELGKGSCYGLGKTEIEALNNFLKEKDEFLEILYNQGLTIPEPIKYDIQKEYSGIFNVRTSPQLHYSLVKQAKNHNQSLNQYVNHILSRAELWETIQDYLDSNFINIENLIFSIHDRLNPQISYYNKTSDSQHLAKLPDDFSNSFEDELVPKEREEKQIYNNYKKAG